MSASKRFLQARAVALPRSRPSCRGATAMEDFSVIYNAWYNAASVVAGSTDAFKDNSGESFLLGPCSIYRTFTSESDLQATLAGEWNVLATFDYSGNMYEIRPTADCYPCEDCTFVVNVKGKGGRISNPEAICAFNVDSAELHSMSLHPDDKRMAALRFTCTGSDTDEATSVAAVVKSKVTLKRLKKASPTAFAPAFSMTDVTAPQGTVEIKYFGKFPKVRFKGVWYTVKWGAGAEENEDYDSWDSGEEVTLPKAAQAVALMSVCSQFGGKVCIAGGHCFANPAAEDEAKPLVVLPGDLVCAVMWDEDMHEGNNVSAFIARRMNEKCETKKGEKRKLVDVGAKAKGKAAIVGDVEFAPSKPDK